MKKTRENSQISDLRERLQQTHNQAGALSSQESDLKAELATALQAGMKSPEPGGVLDQLSETSGSRWKSGVAAATPEENRHISDLSGRLQQAQDQVNDNTQEGDILQVELEAAIQTELETHQQAVEKESDLGGEC